MVAKALMIAVLMALTACQTPSGSFCAISHPVRLSHGTVDVLSDNEVMMVLAHNEKGQKLCGWKP